MAKEAKTSNSQHVRLSDATMERFRAAAAEMGGSQEEAMAMLLQQYEVQQAKAAIPERAKDVDLVRTYADALVEKYLGAIRETDQVTEAVRTRYSSAIEALQGRYSELEAQHAQTQSALKAAADEVADRDAQIGTLKSMLDANQGTIADKERIISALQYQNADMQQRVQEADAVLSDQEKIQARFDQEMKKKDDEIAGLQAKIRDLEATHQQEMSAEMEQHRVALQKVQEEHRFELQQAQDSYRADLQKAQDAHRADLQKAQEKYWADLKAAEDRHQVELQATRITCLQMMVNEVKGILRDSGSSQEVSPSED